MEYLFHSYHDIEANATAGNTEEKDDLPPYVRYRTLIEIMDIFTCILTSLLFVGAMFTLAAIGPLKIRIGVAGALGLAFALSAKLLAGASRRIEIYAAISAFFAVVSVFVSNTD